MAAGTMSIAPGAPRRRQGRRNPAITAGVAVTEKPLKTQGRDGADIFGVTLCARSGWTACGRCVVALAGDGRLGDHPIRAARCSLRPACS